MLPERTTVRISGNYCWSTNGNCGISFLLINPVAGKPVGINSVKVWFFKNVKIRLSHKYKIACVEDELMDIYWCPFLVRAPERCWGCVRGECEGREATRKEKMVLLIPCNTGCYLHAIKYNVWVYLFHKREISCILSTRNSFALLWTRIFCIYQLFTGLLQLLQRWKRT